ncbi:MAG TPA: autotransporter-associated beta strand repeat-containing protein [Verrucomicrobiae bacterium]|nr:autotransporter-associated beta strand repeat-containing protein [Verrucomicrobiae bacterium]
MIENLILGMVTLGRRCLAAAAVLALATSPGIAQLTTNDWQPTGSTASGYWTNASNWSSGIPNSATDVARFATDYTANFTVTQDVSQTVNGIIYNDPGAGDTSVLALRPIGSATLGFAGTSPFIDNSCDLFTAQLQIYTPIDFGAAGLTKTGVGNVRTYGTVAGSGTITVSAGALEMSGNNTNFSGAIVANGATLIELRGGTANTLGTTNVGTTLNDTSRLRLRDLSSAGITTWEPITVNSFNTVGSINAIAAPNVNLAGAVTLNTNGVFSVTPWNSVSQPGSKMDFIITGAISDDGNGRGAHFLFDASSPNATGTVSRTSEIVVGGANSYGGYTHITANRAPDGAGPFSGNLRLTNGNDRLPTGTTVVLGGALNGVGVSSASGRLVLAGNNQELAGLTTLGTGTENRVVGGRTTLSTLTLSVGAGTNNLFGGYIGGPGANENNLALISKGPGILDLAGANTYTGTTTVTNGTLRVNGSHIGGGAYAIQGGGTLGGTGLIAAAIQVLGGGIVAPGNSIGTLTTSNSFDLDGTLQIELANAAGPGAGLSDLLDVNGFFDITNGTLQFVYSETLTNGTYVFAEYDSLSGEPFLDVQNLPFGYTIDYAFEGNHIALVIPEPSALALLALGLGLILGVAHRRGRRRSGRLTGE